MSLPSAYLTSTKNTSDILRAMQAAQAPDRFTIKFLEGLGFAGSNDRAMVNVLKALGMLNESGVPTRRYHEYLDQTRSELVLAEAIREAYSDLFRVNKNANTMSQSDVRNKMKTLSEGSYTDRVLTAMAATFAALVKSADFSKAQQAPDPDEDEQEDEAAGTPEDDRLGDPRGGQKSGKIGDLVYNINIHLPESRDPAVYNALFKSLKEHLG
ncbi:MULTISPECIES: DUF5343 domain-containing protein [unclassified Leifsonia]|uniref:DUF5343 domain-containing protein n=1 Tax=unclassified Leifsonia TaxID=2663824 RepID=UPI000B7DDBC3|nr:MULTISPECIES: DUF5343 domain-containing protein [unclassified Leifsonia]